MERLKRLYFSLDFSWHLYIYTNICHSTFLHFIFMQVPQPGGGGGSSSGASGHRRHVNESDYEEIGPPPPPNNISIQTSRGLGGVDGGGLTSSVSSSQVMVTASAQNSSNDTNANNATAICDLCGTATAIVKCGACAEQIFCLACDDMYHRHPKRSTHGRKAIGEVPVKPPALPPKGDPGVISAPVAPPRKNIRKGSAPDSPVSCRPTPILTRSSTLPRKVGSSMVGRPLPPPPSITTVSMDPPQPLKMAASSQNPPPPALPAKNTQQPPPPALPPSSSHFYPNNNNSIRKMSSGSQPPMHLNFPPKPMMSMGQPEIPMPTPYPTGAMPNPAMMMMMQQQQQQQQQQQPYSEYKMHFLPIYILICM